MRNLLSILNCKHMYMNVSRRWEWNMGDIRRSAKRKKSCGGKRKVDLNRNLLFEGRVRNTSVDDQTSMQWNTGDQQHMFRRALIPETNKRNTHNRFCCFAFLKIPLVYLFSETILLMFCSISEPFSITFIDTQLPLGTELLDHRSTAPRAVAPQRGRRTFQVK